MIIAIRKFFFLNKHVGRGGGAFIEIDDDDDGGDMLADECRHSAL
jgi:hypothetical protein